MFEILRVDSDRQEREDLGLDARQRELEIQASYRFYF